MKDDNKGMTREQLAEFIQSQISNALGDELGKTIRDNIEASVAPLKEKVSQWGEKIADFNKPAPAERKREPGMALARCIRATAASKMNGDGTNGAIQILKNWGDEDLAKIWSEAREKALAAGDATAGGFLVPTQFSQELIDILRSRTVVRSLGAPTLQMPTGTVKIPKITTGSAASYIGENRDAPKTQPEFGQITLTFKKLAALTPVSNDLLRYSSPGADQIVRDDLASAMAVKEDAQFIRGDGTDATPKGMKNWAPAGNVVNANGTVSVQNTAVDLGKLMDKLTSADIPMTRPVWIFNPRIGHFLRTLVNSNGFFIYRDEMATGKLWGWPFAETTGVPSNLDVTGSGANDESEIYFVDISQAIIGESANMMIDASAEAAYNDGTSVQAAFSLDQTVIRAISEHDFAMRYDKAVALLDSVDWKPGSV